MRAVLGQGLCVASKSVNAGGRRPAIGKSLGAVASAVAPDYTQDHERTTRSPDVRAHNDPP